MRSATIYCDICGKEVHPDQVWAIRSTRDLEIAEGVFLSFEGGSRDMEHDPLFEFCSKEHRAEYVDRWGKALVKFYAQLLKSGSVTYGRSSLPKPNPSDFLEDVEK